MSTQGDQVFAVSLSEIAFTLVFVLMLLLGYMVLDESRKRQVAEARIVHASTAENAQTATAALGAASAAFALALEQGGIANPAQLVQQAVSAGYIEAENRRLQQEVLDLTRRIVALEELRQQVQQAGKAQQQEIVRAEVERALVLKNQVERLLVEPGSRNGEAEGEQPQPPQKAGSAPNERRRADTTKELQRIRDAVAATEALRREVKEQLGKSIRPGTEAEVVAEIVDAARAAAATSIDKTSPAALRIDNARLQGTLAYYVNREKLRGLDHPPCWTDSQGKIEYIFNVLTTKDGYVVTRGWPESRADVAPQTDGFKEMMQGYGDALPADRFIQGAQAYLDFGKSQRPECRHFVYLSTAISDADRRDQARKVVNGRFYVLEVSRPQAP